MRILPLSPRLERYLEKHSLEKAFKKQGTIFESNPHHPGLNTELLQPKHFGLYSFRVTQKYRAVFAYIGHATIQIL